MSVNWRDCWNFVSTPVVREGEPVAKWWEVSVARGSDIAVADQKLSVIIFVP